MEPQSYVLLGGLLLGVGFTIFAIWQFGKLATSHIRDITLFYLVLSLFLALLTILPYLSGEGDPGLISAKCVAVLQLWALSGFIHFLNVLEGFRRMKSDTMISLVNYTPVAILTMATAGVALADPGAIRVIWSGGLPRTDFGPLKIFFLGLGGLLLGGILYKELLILKRGKTEVFNEILFLTVFTLLGIIGILNFLFPVEGIPPQHITSLILALNAVPLAYIAKKRSSLIIPRLEKHLPPEDGKGLKARQELRELERFHGGGSFLFLSSDRALARKHFVAFLRNGKPGLWITRRPPREARKEYGLVDTPFLWLTNSDVPGEVCLPADDSARLGRAITDFVAAAGDYVLLFEGIEYVASNTGFSKTLSFIHFLNDRVMATQGMLLLSVSPEVFRPEETALLASEASDVIRGPDAQVAARRVTTP